MRSFLVALSVFGISVAAFADKPTIEQVEITGTFKDSTVLEKFNLFQSKLADATISPKLTDNVDLTKAKKIEFLKPNLEKDTLTNKDFLSSGNGKNLIIQIAGDPDDEKVRAFLKEAVNEIEVVFTDVPLLNGGSVGKVILKIKKK